jgi:type I restriction enzyme S subunit
MEGYTSYQHLQLGWTDILPSHWGVKRLKRVLSERKENNNPVKTNEILSLTNTRGVIPYSEKGNIGNKSKENIEGYHLTYPNDLVVNSMNVVIGSVGVSDYFGAISPVYYALMSRGEANIKYYEYIFRLPSFEETLKGLGNGILEIRMRIPMSKLNNVLLPLPPRVEQDQIVRFLDWKVSEINKLIGIRRKEIQGLEELKARAIDKAVIHGLHVSSETHNDDIRWDIDYPSTWEIERLRNLFTFRKGLSITKANLEPTGIPVISYGQVHSKKNSMVGLNDELFKFVNPSYLQTDPLALVQKGDFIFADTSEDLEGSGNCAYIDRDGKIFAGYHSVIAHPKGSTNNKYFAYLFKSPTWRYQIRKKVNAVKVYSITQQILKDVFLLVPSQKEQQEIVRYLDSVCVKIDSLIESTHKKIMELAEMKSVIISDVVTGKIDVRNVTVPKYEYVDDIADDDSDGDEESDETETEMDEEV